MFQVRTWTVKEKKNLWKQHQSQINSGSPHSLFSLLCKRMKYVKKKKKTVENYISVDFYCCSLFGCTTKDWWFQSCLQKKTWGLKSLPVPYQYSSFFFDKSIKSKHPPIHLSTHSTRISGWHLCLLSSYRKDIQVPGITLVIVWGSDSLEK